MSIRWSDFCMKQFHSNGRAHYTPRSTPTPGPDAACGPNDRLPAGAGDQPTRWRVCERDLSNCSGKLPCSTRTLFVAVLAPVSRMRAAFNHWNPHLHAASKACTRAVGHRRVPTQTDFVQRTARVRWVEQGLLLSLPPDACALTEFNPKKCTDSSPCCVSAEETGKYLSMLMGDSTFCHIEYPVLWGPKDGEVGYEGAWSKKAGGQREGAALLTLSRARLTASQASRIGQILTRPVNLQPVPLTTKQRKSGRITSRKTAATRRHAQGTSVPSTSHDASS